ncbi:HEAT repeat domain-containing protein [Tumidithrix elongata RA019]|uniref:HEAT repeat domain-containing protein n=1 Tax=Tumidithrix elongata BACA0141 TaxID=2716417 RepID=A0AAW9Q791_9CYAN|nr:HEAT repeat domain-containing protein [Tumidithrix elongata RA019]
MDEPELKPVNPERKFAPPRLDDYRIPPQPKSNIDDRSPINQSAPEIGGVAALLTEFDTASRSDLFSQALQKLIRCRSDIVPDLLNRLKSDDLSLAKKAAIALGYIRSPRAISPLIAAAQNPHRQIYPQATSALAWIGSSEAISALIQMLQHPSVHVQAAAAKALHKGNLPAVSPLVDVLKHGDDLVKIQAAHSLGQISSPLAVPALIDALSSPTQSLRFEAAWALGQIRSPLAAIPLATRLTDSDISVQSQAVQALKNIGGDRVIAAISEMLNNSSSHTRSVAARTLGQMGMDEVIPLLVDRLRNDDFPYVRCDAAIALGEIGTYEAVFHLSQAIKDNDRVVRNAVVRALRQINSPDAQEVLKTLNQTISVPQYSMANRDQFTDDSDFTVLQ